MRNVSEILHGRLFPLGEALHSSSSFSSSNPILYSILCLKAKTLIDNNSPTYWRTGSARLPVRLYGCDTAYQPRRFVRSNRNGRARDVVDLTIVFVPASSSSCWGSPFYCLLFIISSFFPSFFIIYQLKRGFDFWSGWTDRPPGVSQFQMEKKQEKRKKERKRNDRQRDDRAILKKWPQFVSVGKKRGKGKLVHI